MNIGTDATKRLYEFLKEEEAIPFYDESGKIVTFKGGDAKIRAQAIRECIRRIEIEPDRPTQEA
jgi:pyruvate-formate lyase-activating enzyme